MMIRRLSMLATAATAAGAITVVRQISVTGGSPTGTHSTPDTDMRDGMSTHVDADGTGDR